MGKFFRQVIRVMMGGFLISAFLFCLILGWGANCAEAEGFVNINTATAEEFMALPGIGAVKAADIVAYREANGDFTAIEEIMKVSGIGESTFEGIRDLITVGGDGTGDDGGDESDKGNQGDQGDGVDYFNLIVVNELLPNPTGSDDFEWIELKNLATTTVDFAGWKVKDASDKIYEIKQQDFESTEILGGGFLVIEKAVSGITLNNDSDQIMLIAPDETVVSEMQYQSSAKDDVSWARMDNGDYSWTMTLTKGEENIITEPAAEAGSGGGSSADAADSIYFGKVILSELYINPVGVDNERNEWIEIENKSNGTVCLEGWRLIDNESEIKLGAIYVPGGKFVILDRKDTGLILQNEGGDEIRLIENKGYELNRVKYSGKVMEGKSYSWCEDWEEWQWLDETTPGQANACPPLNEKPSAYFEMNADEAEAGDYVQFEAAESFDEDGEIVSYRWQFDRPVGAFGIFGDVWEFKEGWFEVKIISSGKMKVALTVVDDMGGEDEYSRIINVREIEKLRNGEIEKLAEEAIIKALNHESIKSSGDSQAVNVARASDGLMRAKNLGPGAKVVVEGTVVVEPGVLGKTIFYINDETSGLQVYSFYKDFPGLALGDRVKITGELSEAQGEMRIKTKTKDDILVLDEGDLPEPRRAQIDDVGEEAEGRFLQFEGEVTEIKGSGFWLDDKTGEVKVYVKQNTQIDPSELMAGDTVRVAGIVGQMGEEYQLWPRYRDDLVVLNAVRGEEDVVGGVDDDKNNEWVKYVVAIVFAIIIIVATVWLRRGEIKKLIKKGN